MNLRHDGIYFCFAFQVSIGGGGSGKVSVELQKGEEPVRWTNIGRTLDRNGHWAPLDSREVMASIFQIRVKAICASHIKSTFTSYAN